MGGVIRCPLLCMPILCRESVRWIRVFGRDYRCQQENRTRGHPMRSLKKPAQSHGAVSAESRRGPDGPVESREVLAGGSHSDAGSERSRAVLSASAIPCSVTVDHGTEVTSRPRED